MQLSNFSQIITNALACGVGDSRFWIEKLIYIDFFEASRGRSWPVQRALPLMHKVVLRL